MTDRLLPVTLTLHDIRDVEAFCRTILNNWLQGQRQGTRGPRAWLREADYDDALSWLIGTSWELSERYNPELNTSFSKYAKSILPRRIIDWYRQRWGDTRNPHRVQPLSLEAERELRALANPDAPPADIDPAQPSDWEDNILTRAALGL